MKKNENLDLMTSLSDVVQISLNIEQFKCGATESHNLDIFLAVTWHMES